MAEGDVHRWLVRLLAEKIVEERPLPWARFVDGLLPDEKDGKPPLLDTYRPDIYALERGSGRTVIGEAKTADDIDNDHTKRQLTAYFRHLSQGTAGELWIAVPFMSAGTAYRVCRVVRKRMALTQVSFVITGWLFGPKPFCEIWHG